MYIDLLTRLKNAQAVKKENIKIPYSKMDEAVLQILRERHYVEDFEKRGRMPKRVLDIKLRYDNGVGVIQGVKFLSTPSRRLFAGVRELKPVKHGYGLLVVSTPKGVIAGDAARRFKVGGQLLFEIW